MINKTRLLSILLFPFASILFAQVPVRKEPRHRPVFENKYIRLLDVVLMPSDTSQFHIHDTPSLFVNISNSKIGTQLQNQEWTKDEWPVGKAWYRSFSPDILIHRVTNCGTLPIHINDIEILSSYETNLTKSKPLPFPVLFENEKSLAYQLLNQDFEKKTVKTSCPLVAELVAGERLIFHFTKTNLIKELKVGEYLYIEPETSFYYTSESTSAMNLIFFEIK